MDVGYLLGAGTTGFAWISNIVVRKALDRREHRKEQHYQLLQEAERGKRLSNAVFYQHFEKLRQLVNAEEAGDLDPLDYSIQYGWTGSACGRGICALGMGHAGGCRF